MNKNLIILFLFSLLSFSSFSQPRFSIATDLGLQRSFKKEQQYWAVGQTVQVQYNINPKSGFYTWISYYSVGKFRNHLTATAKSTTTTPQLVNYDNDAQMRFKHFSLGWRRYLKGSCIAEEKWSLYGYAGLGILLGRVFNIHSVSLDTSIYFVPVRAGKANFKRLTADLGLGWEMPVGADVYLYAEGRVWIPTTDYPSKYLFVNDNAPFVGMVNFGLRILF